MPAPRKDHQLPSPVPQYTIAGLAGLKASAPTASVAA
jgi:hypothetical protein